MADMPAIDYWLPWWWDHIGRGFPREPARLGLAQQNVVIANAQMHHGGLPPGGGGLGGGPPPAAGAAAVAVDEEAVRRVRHLKEIKERQKRMIRR